jgi:hypothetical protein
VTQAVLDAAPASAAARKSADVSAALTFIARSDAKPVFHSAAYTGGAPQVFFDTERHTVLIRDMRPLEGALSLEREGFELLRDRTAVRDLYDDDALERVYYPEIEALLREVTGASRVVVFDATRRSDGDAGARNRDGMRGPASRVHVDYTERCTWTTPRGARGLHREERPATGQGSARRGRGRAACRVRRPDHPDQRVAADPRAGAGLAAGAGRSRPGAARPG